ncbi:MAG: SpoIIE family protein phosphatase [Planctomycetota bacterium]|nr:SpoIIE family protein phosphatase [Planctomycetota bacterium]
MTESWSSVQTGFLTGDKAKDTRNVAILLDTIAEVSRNHDLQQVMRSIVDKAIAVMSAERGLLLLRNDAGELELEVARDKQGNPLPPNVQHSKSVPKRVFETGEAVTLMDAAGGDAISLGQSILDLRLLSVMCTPLNTIEETIGVLYVDSKATNKGFTQSDLELFKTLGAQCAMALQNARLLQAFLDKQKMQQSLYIARDIQTGMLPKEGLQQGNFEMAGFNRACEETGGDYFDYIALPGSRVGLVIGDVSGHGIGAALFMTTARALLRAFAYKQSDPALVVGSVNDFLERDMPPGSFMSLFFGELDTNTGMFRYASAGHNPVLLHRKSAGAFEEFGKTGPALGVVPGVEYGTGGTAPLQSGDMLLLYTDGLPEAMNPDRELFGLERAKNLIVGLQERPAAEIVNQLVRAVVEYAKREVLEDDLTLMVVKAK